MEKREIKKILKQELEKLGFRYTKSAYYYMDQELIIVVELQHSNYDETFFINYGFLIKALHPELKYPKENDCNPEKFSKIISSEGKRIFLPVIEDGLNRYFELDPSAIARTTKKARDYLGIY